MTKNEHEPDSNLDSKLTGQLMKLKDFVLSHTSSEERLQEIAAKITPLPKAIAPSESFLQQMRLRLLQLGENRTSQRAA